MFCPGVTSMFRDETSYCSIFEDHAKLLAAKKKEHYKNVTISMVIQSILFKAPIETD